MPGRQRRAAVLGKPISHSLSPVLHRAAYELLGLDWHYSAVEMDEAGLPEFLASRDDTWVGLSLTMPLKQAVLPLLDDLSPLAEEVGAVNTVIFRDGRRSGDNTDVPGMAGVFRDFGISGARSVTVLGGGATATATLAALREISPERIVVVVRRPEAGRRLRDVAERLGVGIEVAPWGEAGETFSAELVVSTVPAGAADSLVRCVGPRPPGLLVDVVYAPWPTALARAWADHGGPIAGGLELLIRQAALQVALMHGGDIDAESLVPVMRAAPTTAPTTAPRPGPVRPR